MLFLWERVIPDLSSWHDLAMVETNEILIVFTPTIMLKFYFQLDLQFYFGVVWNLVPVKLGQNLILRYDFWRKDLNQILYQTVFL